MPLPIIVGGIALAAGAAGLVTGAKGAKKIADAKSRVNEADEKYENSKSLLNETEMKTTNQLDILGALKVQVWKDLKKFIIVQTLKKRFLENLLCLSMH